MLEAATTSFAPYVWTQETFPGDLRYGLVDQLIPAVLLLWPGASLLRRGSLQRALAQLTHLRRPTPKDHADATLCCAGSHQESAYSGCEL